MTSRVASIAGVFGLLCLLWGGWEAFLVTRQLHLQEQRWLLAEDRFFNGSANDLFVLGKLDNRLAYYHRRISSETHDMAEQENALLLFVDPAEFIPVSAEGVFPNLVMKGNDALRRLLGNRPFPNANDHLVLRKMAYALRMMTEKQYAEALREYDSIDPMGLPRNYKGYVDVNRAFCLYLMGEQVQAQSLLKSVANAFGNDRVATQARKINWLVDEQIAVMQETEATSNRAASPDLLEMNRARAILLQCRQMLDDLQKMDVIPKSAEAEILYYKGLCQEETGSPQEAAETYANSLSKGVPLDRARQINRRLYLATQFEPRLKAYQELSTKMAKRLGDTTILVMHQIFAEREVERQKLVSVPQSPSVGSGYESGVVQGAGQGALGLETEGLIVISDSLRELVDEVVARLDVTEPQAPDQESPSTTPMMSRDTSTSRSEILPGDRVVIRQMNGRILKGVLLSPSDAAIVRLRVAVGTVALAGRDIQEILIDQ